MKKIVIVAPLSNPGGTEISLIRMLNHLPAGLFDITLVLLTKNQQLEKNIPTWVHIKHINHLGCIQFLKTELHSKGFSGLFGAVYAIIKRKILRYISPELDIRYYACLMKQYETVNDKFDVAISWSLPKSVENIYVAYRINAEKNVMWIHLDVQWDGLNRGTDTILERYDSIVCVSKACKNSFDKQYPKYSSKTKVLFNILDQNGIRKKSMDIIKGMPNARLVLVTCGRISKEKHPEYSIYIVNELLKKGITDFKWLFVGGNENMEDDFRKLIEVNHLEDHIILLGFQNNPYPYMKAADIYVQMSEHESFCMALAEAQIIGVPAVTTKFPSSYEIVDNHNTGLIVNHTAEDVLIGIQHLIQDPFLLGVMRNNLKQKKFSIDGSIEQYIELLDNI